MRKSPKFSPDLVERPVCMVFGVHPCQLLRHLADGRRWRDERERAVRLAGTTGAVPCGSVNP